MTNGILAADGTPAQLYMEVPLQEGTDYNSQNIGSIIVSVVIDNITPSWLFIAAANRYVPPLTWGVVFQATSNSRDGRCLWRNPPGQIAASTLNLGTAQVIFTDQFIAPSSGVSLLTPNQVVHLLTAPGGVGSPITVGPVTPPPGTNSLIVVTSNAVQIQIQGNQSGQFYLNDAASGVTRTNGVAFCPIDLGTDTTYNIIVFFTGTLGKIYVDASFVVQSVAIENVPLPILINGISGGSLGPSGSLPVNEQGFNGVNVGVNSAAQPYRSLVAGSQIAEEVFTRPTYHINGNVASLVANTGQTVIAAPGIGSSIVLRRAKMTIEVAPAATARLKLGTVSGSTNAYLGAIILPAATTPLHPIPVDWDDFLLGDNLPLILTSTVAMTVDYTFKYGIVTTANWPQE